MIWEDIDAEIIWEQIKEEFGPNNEIALISYLECMFKNLLKIIEKWKNE